MTPHPLSGQFRRQAAHSLPGSPLYLRLLTELADDLDRGGAAAALLAGHEGDRPGTVLPLRLLGAVHRLVLTGTLPELAPFYPSAGGTEPPDGAWKVLQAVLAERAGELRELLEHPVQTNETGRAALLYGGLQVVAQRSGLPVRLLEIGASAGLNLLVDRYRYDVALPGRPDLVSLGDPASPLVFDRPWEGLPPADPVVPPPIAERGGCDPAPLDPASPGDRLTLTSYVWADDRARLARLRAALAVAATDPPAVERAGAARWLAQRLAGPVPGTATVVWHSVMWQYVGRDERRQILDVLADAAARAGADTPLAHLRYEPATAPRWSGVFELRLSSWPAGGLEDGTNGGTTDGSDGPREGAAGRQEVLATGPGHGIPARWSL